MRISHLLIAFFVFAGLEAAQAQNTSDAPLLQFPLACTLGETCWTARYNDREPGPSFTDFTCGSRTQNRHYGTDFALRDLGAMRTGVKVLAAAEGVVKAVRSTEPDISIKEQNPDDINGKECGNGVVIEHSGNWTTQYCHMKQNSIRVAPGDTVSAGDPLGEVGLSGNTEYPHMHLTVRRGKNRVDPFDGQEIASACTADTTDDNPLWASPVAYEEMALVYVSLKAQPPTGETRWEPEPSALSSESPALIVTGRAFGAQKGDRWLLRILKPGGSVFYEHTLTLDRDRQFQLQYAGKKRPSGGFTPGIWTGEVVVLRQHSDGTVKRFQQATSITISR
ncbi:M23 family metallopeptidase [Kordiimonas pumila]|uniref:M23 family metallopeptidase n=1 Tax=Kordiimonas pumila TaxID=2161677 RepID=A0ABV7D567_9PROT|nr:M23 family metallopeptidase [Kordiimonas pumila]